MKLQPNKKPFHLSGEQIQSIEKLISEMTLQEKIGQLFLPIHFIEEEEELRQFVRKYQPAGLLNRPAPAMDNLKKHAIMQQEAKIPLLIPANLESGGNGIALEGTVFGNPLQIAATGNKTFAYELGRISAAEGKAAGVNYAFAPIVDIDYNSLNPITNTRTFGSNPDTVVEMASAYIDGLMSLGSDFCYSIKHFPGDGVDDRDQHLHTTFNTLSVLDWEDTYGKIYRRLIDKGAPTVMAGHIGLPEYVKKINPNAGNREILCPASLSKELITGLLRESMGFEGVVITDSTSMNGFYAYMSREQAIPTAISNGCDMILFNFNVEEDYEFMEKGIENGILSIEQINDAVSRVLALKTSMGLFEKKQNGTLIPRVEGLTVIGAEEHKAAAKACAKQAVTLVKSEPGVLPISTGNHKRLMIYILGDQEDFYGNKKVGGLFVEAMEREGFEVEVFDRSVKFPNPQEKMRDFINRYDAVIYILSEGTSSNQTTVRLKWNLPLANDAPWFVNDLPVIVVSFANPYHLRDLPQIKTYINAYTTSEYNVEAVVDKLLGRSSFTGKNPVDTSCGYFELKLSEAEAGTM